MHSDQATKLQLLRRQPFLALALAFVFIGLAACGKSSNQHSSNSQTDPLLVMADDSVNNAQDDAPTPQETDLLNQLLTPDSDTPAETEPKSERPHPHPHPKATPWPAPPSLPPETESDTTPDQSIGNSTTPPSTPSAPAPTPDSEPTPSGTATPVPPAPTTPPTPSQPPVTPPTVPKRPAPTPPRRPKEQPPQKEPQKDAQKEPATPAAPAPKPRYVIRGFWEDARKEGRQWTAFAIDAIDQFGGNLMKTKPTDIADFCPAFGSLDAYGRKHFWVKLISAIAAAESSYQPGSSYTESFADSSGANVVSRGLLQISMESANGYGCGIRRAADLEDAQTNISCGVRILDRWVSRDGVISDSDEDNWYGATRYWSVVRSTSSKLKTIQQLLKQTALCRSK